MGMFVVSVISIVSGLLVVFVMIMLSMLIIDASRIGCACSSIIDSLCIVITLRILMLVAKIQLFL